MVVGVGSCLGQGGYPQGAQSGAVVSAAGVALVCVATNMSYHIPWRSGSANRCQTAFGCLPGWEAAVVCLGSVEPQLTLVVGLSSWGPMEGL